MVSILTPFVNRATPPRTASFDGSARRSNSVRCYEWRPIIVTPTERLLAKLRQLRAADEKLHLFGASAHKYELNGCLSKRALVRFETKYNVTLPDEYRDFLLHMGNGGAGPGYGVFPLGKHDGSGSKLVRWKERVEGQLATEFPLTAPWQPDLDAYPDSFESDEAEDAGHERQEARQYPPEYEAGLLPICHHGCALRSYLVVTGQQRGQVWFDGRPDDEALRPHLVKGEGVTFMQWYEDWLDRYLREASAPATNS